MTRSLPVRPAASADRRIPASSELRVERVSIADIPRETWDAAAARNPWATPFSGWAFQRAWWDAYGANAHEETLVLAAGRCAAADAEPVAIVPLMHRHEVEPSDAVTHTTMRHGADLDADARSRRPPRPSSSAPRTTPTTRRSWPPRPTCRRSPPRVAGYLAEPADRRPWDVVDLRRLRCGDPAADALAAAFGAREIAEGWTLNVEREDVCPVVDAARRRRHRGLTSRRSARRSATRSGARSAAPRRVGEVRLDDSPDPLADLETFIDLHQKRWGDDGLFPDTPGGAQSRVLFRRLFELHGPDGPLRLSFLSVGGRRIAAGIHFEPRRRLPLLQRRRRPRRARPVARRADGLRATSRAPSRPACAGSTSCAATSRTSTSGARSTSPSSGCSSGAGTADMSAPAAVGSAA